MSEQTGGRGMQPTIDDGDLLTGRNDCDDPVYRSGDGPNWRFDVAGVAFAALAPGFVHAYHFIDGTITTTSALLGCGIGLILSTALLGLALRGYACQKFPVPTNWTLVGLAFGTLISIIAVIQQSSAGGLVVDPAYFIAAVATYGASAGYAAGFYREYAYEQTAKADNFSELFGGLPYPAVHFVLDGDHARVRQTNAVFADRFGVEADTVRGEPIGEFVLPPDAPSDSVSMSVDQLHTEGRLEAGLPLETDQGVRYFDLYTFPTTTQSTANTGIAIAIDVTERRRREQRIAVLNRVLRHDLRTDAQVIEGYADLLENGKISPSEATQKINDTVDELVDISNKTHKVKEMLREEHENLEPTDITEILEHSITDIEREFPDLDIQFDLPDSAQAYADERLATAVKELLENAVKHGSEMDGNNRQSVNMSGDASAFQLSVGVSKDGETVDITISDNGPGIPEMEQQVHSSGTETELKHSSGVGLWMVDWIVEDLGGSLALESGQDGQAIISVPVADRGVE